MTENVTVQGLVALNIYRSNKSKVSRVPEEVAVNLDTCQFFLFKVSLTA